jgi:putative Holliday junction resolvase
MAYYLAFDFGLKNIGLAYGTDFGKNATELPPLKARDGIPDWGKIEQLIKEYQPTAVIVGLPLNMDGSASELSRRATKFSNRLNGRFGVAIELMDERLSSFEAKEEAKTSGHKGDYGKNPIDSIAARLILQSWFNQLP